jgi:hypothetical protein
MDSFSSKRASFQIFVLLCFIGVGNSNTPIPPKQDLSVWEEIIDRVTGFAREIGYPRAGGPCVDIGKDLQSCVVIEEDGTMEEIPFLECDQLVGAFGVGLGQCKVKGWAVFLLIAVVMVIPVSLIMGLACCCMRC